MNALCETYREGSNKLSEKAMTSGGRYMYIHRYVEPCESEVRELVKFYEANKSTLFKTHCYTYYRNIYKKNKEWCKIFKDLVQLFFESDDADIHRTIVTN